MLAPLITWLILSVSFSARAELSFSVDDLKSQELDHASHLARFAIHPREAELLVGFVTALRSWGAATRTHTTQTNNWRDQFRAERIRAQGRRAVLERYAKAQDAFDLLRLRDTEMAIAVIGEVQRHVRQIDLHALGLEVWFMKQTQAQLCEQVMTTPF